MRKHITFLLATILIASLVIIGLSCGVDETEDKLAETPKKDYGSSVVFHSTERDEVSERYHENKDSEAESVDQVEDNSDENLEKVEKKSTEELINDIYKITSREEAWQRFEELYKEKSIITIQDVENIWFKNDSDKEPDLDEPIWLADIDELPKKVKNPEIEKNSYWPERKLGQLSEGKIENDDPKIFDISGVDNFPLLIYRYIQTSNNYQHAYTREITINVEIKPWEPFKFYMIPLSRDVWLIYNYFGGNRVSMQYSIVEFSESQMKQVLDWQIGYTYVEYLEFVAISDINLDGIPDVVMKHFGIPAGHVSSLL